MSHHPLYHRVRTAFQNQFGRLPDVVVHAPGRINLIGEHTDYNHGFVLPAAIAQGVWFAMGQSDGPEHEWYAPDTGELIRMPADLEIPYKGWAGYFQGAYHILCGRIGKPAAIRCVFSSDLPVGAGLSSSSALTSGFLLGMDKLFDLQYSRAALAWLAHLVEHDFIGLQGGIMDQHACLLAKAGHFLFLDCFDRSFEHIAFNPEKEDIRIFLINTHVRHTLTDTDYNTRAAECTEALGLLRDHAGIENLRRIMDLDLTEYADVLGSLLLRRLLFVQQENIRVLRATQALRAGHWRDLGILLNESHRGLRDEYEVSCPELDFLAHEARHQDIILGARMMGGGFGGCTINLSRGPLPASWVEGLLARYKARFGMDAEIIRTWPAEGATTYRER